MPIPSTPSIMPNVLGYAADTVQIPETTPTGQGIPSFRDLFPFITQVDPDAGGVMVERAWMNALFNLLGQHAFFQQSGCVYPWQATLNYIAGSHVKGSDDVEYIALQPSGPDVSGTGAKDPAQQANRAYWVSLESFVSGDFVPDSRRVIAGTGLTGGGPLSSDVTLTAKLTNSVSTTDSTTAASATAVKAAYDAANERLPLSGGTLTGALRSKPGNIHVASTPSADEVDDALYLVDANGVVYATLQSTNYANGSMLVGLAVNTSVKGGSGGWQTLKIGADKTGKFISHVPTPDLSDASDNIANTVYVQENLKSYLKLAGGILTGDVTVPSVNGYQVVDHEVNGGWYFFPENFYNSGRNGRFLTKAGLKVQYGGVSGMSDVTQQVTFAEPFSTIPIVITTSESSGIEQITVPLGVTTTGFSLGHMSAGTQTGTVFKHWIAIGR
ncbi:MAG: tail fiber protein [Klebsiella aerogenes]|nr:tail fiber protein [Klebsiella aerogenes]